MKNVSQGLDPSTRLGLKVEVVDDASFLDFKRLLPTGNEFVTRSDMAEIVIMAAETHVRQRFLLGKWEEFERWCQELLECVEHFFFGEFRSEEAEIYSWVNKLKYGIGWGGVVGLWSSIDKLLAYPIESLEPDSEGKCAHQFYVGLTKWWKDRTNLDWVERVKNVGGAGSKYYHLLADSACSIAEKDNAGFNKNIEKCIQQYYKSQRGDFEFPMAAIFLRNLAEREGIIVNVPEDVDKYLFGLPKGV